MAEEEYIQQLRSKAAELFLREEWNDSIDVYSNLISHCTHHQQQLSLHHPNHLQKLHKSLCIALCNRAEARSRLRDFHCALQDCDRALQIDASHFKTLLCKGKILLCLNRYSMALECFKAALLDSQAGFHGKPPELAEYIGAVEIRKSDISGRGLFATKNIDAGSLILVTRAIVMERSILAGKDLSEDAQLAMWKNFIQKVSEFARKCYKTRDLIGMLSIGEDEEELEIPDIDLFRPENVGNMDSCEMIDMEKLLAILDVNSLTEDAVSANVLRKNNDSYGVGLWLLPSFINHSCCPNSRRLHVGDYLIVHASKDMKAGEEITFAYLDPLSPLSKRREMSMTWGIQCKCKRCRFENEVFAKQEIKEIEIGLERGMDVGGVVYKLEEHMKRLKAYRSDRSMKRWGRRIPAMDAVVDSVVDVVGGDHRLLKIMVEELKKNGGGGSGLVGMEKALKLARDVYGKVVKKQAMKTLVEFCIGD
ncbi:hypothetical protein Ahy_A03g010869 isoform A [Arachis hypogaea]|uniref:SET domain-containing protein n=1 Tax=Arachis hypogaea TaxID=3818 RepID=A0A445DNT3_ARAHY|nr:hypothetical protein Ahy_A03g010869 isoform A [Arachis hypogaea]